jgi:oligoribonuclease
MPRVDNHLHPSQCGCLVDQGVSRRWFPRLLQRAGQEWRAPGTADILESIRELDYYRKAVFVSDPSDYRRRAGDLASVVCEVPAAPS